MAKPDGKASGEGIQAAAAVEAAPAAFNLALNTAPAPAAFATSAPAGAVADTETELPAKLDQLARLVFEKKFFGYNYDANPPNMKEGGEVRRFAKMCSLEKPEEAHGYIKDVIMT